MWDHLFIYLFIFHNVGFAECGYPPMGDEVQAGSVLLPASRRGRYLANIVRRQAVDGTGIKFNKDADRMNAEAKKKVDVLSEELLPYIIAEQERRTTLYKRVMTAIQNGEKGVTIAEIRNKPPAIIRKGLMYRCPTNRAPREPDGSGVIMCEDNQKPKDIIFESCLSAEDKELYVADNKYFFCNRHKVEGPDLPRNGTTVIGCAPCERTPLNYTSQKCALEDTDDVVVHYRYYPDRTYKFVSELDPEREVCDHWNPCQIGYIFSLPGPDQATPASELWPDYAGDTDEEISREEIVPPVPEDNKNETALMGMEYSTSLRRVHIPDGFRFDGIGKYMQNGQRSRVSQVQEGARRKTFQENLWVHHEIVGEYVKIKMIFKPLHAADMSTYYVRFERLARKGEFIHVPMVTISLGQTQLIPALVEVMPAQHLNVTSVTYTCEQCALRGIMLRAADGTVRNLDLNKYNVHKTRDERGVERTVIVFDFGTVTAQDFGDYFLIMQNDDGSEERIKAMSFKVPETDPNSLISVERIRTAVTVGSPVDISTTYNCEKVSCELKDVLCHGVSVMGSGGVGHIATSRRININFASFEDYNACVYLAIFKIGDEYYRKNFAIFENASPEVELVGADSRRVAPPAEGAHYEHTIHYKCSHADCSLTNVTVNGFPLETMTRRSSVGSVGYFLPGDRSVTIGFTEYSSLYEGVYQGVFALGAHQVTKTLMEIGPETDAETEPATEPDAETEPVTEPDVETEPATEPDAETTEPDTETTEPDTETEPATEPDTETEPATEPVAETEPDAESEPSTEPEAVPTEAEPQAKRRSAVRAGGAAVLRGAVAAGGAYHGVVRAAPAAVRCRGAAVGAGWRQVDNDTLNVDFDHFEDSNACVYMGIFKNGQTEHRKTIAVLENSSPMINVSARAVVPPPVGGALKHTVVYTCNVTKCDPQKIYINDRTLRSDDKERFYSYKSEMVKGPNGEVMTVTVNFSIAPFTKEFEGVYQVVVSTGTVTVTKNIMEVGALV